MNDLPLKNIWFWVAVILITGTVFLYLRFDNLPIDNDNRQARLVIYFGDDKTRAFEPEDDEDINNLTVLEALYAASLAGDFDFRYRVKEDGSIILDSIQDFISDNNVSEKDWRFYLNGKSMKTADINKVTVNEGDLVEVKYEFR